VERWTALRMRLDRFGSRFALGLIPPLLYFVALVTVVKLARVPSSELGLALYLGAGLALLPIAFGLSAWFERRPKHGGALELDRFHGLEDRLTTALAFADQGGERSPFVQAAIEDGLEHSKQLSPRRAVPFHLPRELWLCLGLIAALVGLLLVEVRFERARPAVKAPLPVMLTRDDIELFKQEAKAFDQKTDDPETLRALAAFNRLIQDIEERRLDQRQVFERLLSVERDLTRVTDLERAALEESMRDLARELGQSSLARPVAEPLAEQRLPDAEKALRELSERLKSKTNPPTKAELAQLRKALEQASKASQKSAEKRGAEEQALQREKDRLLKKKQEGKALSPDEQKKLANTERKLERLNRERERRERAQQKMSELDRELAEAAAELAKAAGAGSEEFEQAADEVQKMEREKMTDEQKRELLQRIKEMKELIRQQGSGGKQRLERLRQFGKRARGEKGEEGEQGEGSKGKGKGKDGKGQKLEPALIFGPGGEGMEVSMPSSGKSGSGAPGDDSGGQGESSKHSYGTGHDPNMRGDQTSLDAETHDVSAVAQDTGQGSASAQVIYGAAERGFSGTKYRDVYTDYRAVAEQVLHKDEIPPGYRFYVQRYFQLIRPRD
jgi:hypothetical protein